MQLIVDDWARFQPVRTGLAIAAELRRRYPHDWDLTRYDALLANRATFDGIKRGVGVDELQASWQGDLKRWVQSRQLYLLYPD